MLVLSQSRTDYLGRYTPLAASNGKHDPLPSRMVEVRKLASSDKGERHIGGNHIGSRLGLRRAPKEVWEGLRGVLELSRAFGGLPFGFLKVEKEGFRIRSSGRQQFYDWKAFRTYDFLAALSWVSGLLG